MEFFINELSFSGQAENIYEADELMTELICIIKEIDEIRGKDRIKTNPIISSCQLVSNLTLYEWLQRKFQSSNSRDKRVARELTEIIRKGNINILNLLGNNQYFYNKKDVSDSSIAGAAYLEGILISLQNAEEFLDEYITVNLTTEHQENQDITIHNLTQISQARNICPRYKPSPKHNPTTVWKDATVMDLSDQEAQIALNQSIEFKGQRFSYYNEKFYKFHDENTYDEQGYPTYHGYPVNSADIPNEIRPQLID